MGRKTSRKDFVNIINRLRKAMPDIILRTTLITGFLGEEDEDIKDPGRDALAAFLVCSADVSRHISSSSRAIWSSSKNMSLFASGLSEIFCFGFYDFAVFAVKFRNHRARFCVDYDLFYELAFFVKFLLYFNRFAKRLAYRLALVYHAF